MVGIWYDRYDTSLKLTVNKPHIAAAASMVRQGLDIDAGDSAEVTLIISEGLAGIRGLGVRIFFRRQPGIWPDDGSGPFTPDEIIKTRWAFHCKTLAILETFFYREKDLFRDPGVEPHMRFTTSFDETLPVTHDNALVELAKDPYMGSRCNSRYPC